MGLLTRYERRTTALIAETLLPKTDVLPDTAAEIGVVDRVEKHLLTCNASIRKVFRAMVLLIEFGAVLRTGRRWSRLSDEGKRSILEDWRASKLYVTRLLFKLVEANIYMAYYSHADVCRRLGYAPPPARRRVQLPEHLETADQDLFLKADVCVIGSGAGGAVVAKELSEQGRSVVLLEEGGYFSINDFGVEAMEVMEKIYHNGGTQMTTGLPSIVLPTGRAVGGTTIINSGTCFRLPEKVINRWRRQFGLSELTSEGLAPYFDRVEKQLHVVPVSEDVLGNNAKIFRRGLEKMGLKGLPLPRNVQDCRGAGMCCFGCPNDAKQSVQLSYVPQAIQNGARLLTRCRVERIIPQGDHGGDVLARFVDSKSGRPGRAVRVSAKTVVIAAGTLHTPRLLRWSGLLLHNRHVGRHITIHPTGKIIGIFPEEVRGWEGVPQGFSYDGLAEEGIMFEGAFTPPSFASISLNLPVAEHKSAMENYSHLATFGFLMSDQGRGLVRWMPDGEPIVFYNVRRAELAKFVKAIRFLCEVFLAAGCEKIFTSIKSFPIIRSASDLRAFDGHRFHRSDLDIAAFHPLGTCRMGADPDQSVVDGNGEVHGLKNLFIADGSIFPSSLGVNPQETIMAFANRTADYIHRRLG